jgi:hypothetical protein
MICLVAFTGALTAQQNSGRAASSHDPDIRPRSTELGPQLPRSRPPQCPPESCRQMQVVVDGEATEFQPDVVFATAG